MINSIIVKAAVLGVFLSIPLAFYSGPDKALALSLGSLLGIANLFAIKKLLEACLLSEKRTAKLIAFTFLIKFPLLYLMGYYLLFRSGLPVSSTLAGISLIFVAALLSATRNALVKS